MRRDSGAYVLVTCLFVLAVVSVAAVATMRSTSVMAQHARALEVAARQLREADDALQLMEAALLRGEPQGAGAAIGCETGTAARVRVSRLHERSFGGEGADQTPKWVVYGLRACRDGRALMEATLGVVEPIGAIEESALPKDVKVGRLSWRRVW